MANNGSAQTVSDNFCFADGHGALNEYCELLERFEDRLTLRNLRLAERYKNGDLKLLIDGCWDRTVNFRIILQGADRHEACGDAESRTEGFSTGGHAANVNFTIAHRKQRGGPICHHGHVGGGYRNDSLVFIQGVKFMQNPQRGIPSFVWFQSPNEAVGFGADALYFSYRGFFKMLDGCTNRKSCSSTYLFTIGEDKVADELIECGPEIVDNVSNNGTDTDWNRFVNTHAVDILSGLCVVFTNGFVWFGLVEGLEKRFEFRDVLFGPFDF